MTVSVDEARRFIRQMSQGGSLLISIEALIEAAASGRNASPSPSVPSAGVARPSWDDYFCWITEVVASRADCSRAQVGCVIVDASHRIVATGYNGPPAGDDRSCMAGDCPRGRSDHRPDHDYSACIALHAEQNAVAYAGQAARGGTAYTGKPPCDMCTKVLQAAGVVRIVVVGQGEVYPG